MLCGELGQNRGGLAKGKILYVKTVGSGSYCVDYDSHVSMAVIIVSCPHCDSKEVYRHGKTASGYPRYQCRSCRKTFSDAPERGCSEEVKDTILATYQERMSMRGVARTFKISRNTLSAWLKEKGGDSLP